MGETFFGKTRVLIIERDEDASNPRDDDNLGVMACWHRRYDLGDNPRETAKVEPVKLLQKLRRDGLAAMLPLFLYDHSGITMRTSPYSCPWDSGQVGFIYVTREKARKEMGWKRITKARAAKLAEYLTGEVETYDQYLTGDVYWFRLFAKETCALCEGGGCGRCDGKGWVEGEELDSCGGFYGHDIRDNGILDCLSAEDKADLEIEQETEEARRVRHLRAKARALAF